MKKMWKYFSKLTLEEGGALVGAGVVGIAFALFLQFITL